MSDISGILEDLAAGRIDPSVAAERIAAAQRDQNPEEGERTARRADQETDEQPAEQTDAGQTDEGQPEADQAKDAEPEQPAEDGTDPMFVTGEAVKRADELLDDVKDFASNAASRLRRAWAAVSDDPKAETTKQGDESPAAEAGASSSSDSIQQTRTNGQTKTGPKAAKGVDRVSIRSIGRRVRVVADPSVSSVTVEGPHLLRRNGTTVEITSDGDLGPSLRHFSLIRPPKSREDLRTVGFGKQIVVRVNPDIVVDAEVTAGSLKVTDVAVLGKIRVTTGSATLEGASQVTDALVQAGTATLHGPIKQGRSLIRVESGSLHVKLAEGANVTVKGDAQLGRVSWPVEGKATMDELVVGNGAAKLDLAVVMGHISIGLDADQD